MKIYSSCDMPIILNIKKLKTTVFSVCSYKYEFEQVIYQIQIFHFFILFQQYQMFQRVVMPTSITVIIIIYIFSGTTTTIYGKFQNQQYVFEGGIEKQFYHPFIENFIPFILYTFAIPILYALKAISWKSKAELDGIDIQNNAVKKGKKKFNPSKILVSSICETIATLMQGIALNFIPASSYQMIRGGKFATVFLFSILYLRVKMQKHHIIGIALATLGIIIVGCTSLLFSASSYLALNQTFQIIGNILVATSLFFRGFSQVYEEQLLRTHDVDPIRMLGYVGLFGMALNVPILIIATNLPCPFTKDACSYTFSGFPYMERPQMYFIQLYQNPQILEFCVIGIVSMVSMSICQLSVKGYMNSSLSSLCNSIQSAVIWIIGIITTLTIGQDQDQYRIQRTEALPILFQASGFIMLILGNVIYSQINKFPYQKPDKKLPKLQAPYL